MEQRANARGYPMFATLSSCVLVLLVSSVAQVPKEPDFSGEWGLAQASTAASGPAPALAGSAEHHAHDHARRTDDALVQRAHGGAALRNRRRVGQVPDRTDRRHCARHSDRKILAAGRMDDRGCDVAGGEPDHQKWQELGPPPKMQPY